jgi:hypothetical protein
MTDKQWRSETDLWRLFDFLHRGGDPRKLRLLACAALRSCGFESASACAGQAIEMAERFADGLATAAELAHANQHAREVDAQAHRDINLGSCFCEITAANPEPAELTGICAWLGTGAIALVREVFGPCLRCTIDPGWLTWNDHTVARLARTICDDSDFKLLPVLADALEESGCTEVDLLGHCRGPGMHVKGCWALDLLLDRPCWRAKTT